MAKDYYITTWLTRNNFKFPPFENYKNPSTPKYVGDNRHLGYNILDNEALPWLVCMVATKDHTIFDDDVRIIPMMTDNLEDQMNTKTPARRAAWKTRVTNIGVDTASLIHIDQPTATMRVVMNEIVQLLDPTFTLRSLKKQDSTD